MKIALIEIYQHLELIRNLTRVFHHLSYDVTVCTNPFCYDLLDKNVIELARWIVVRDNKEWPSVIGSVAPEHDLIFFTTLPYDNPDLIDASLRKPTVCIIHNGHHFLATWRQAALWQKPSLQNLMRLYRTMKASKHLSKKTTNKALFLTFMSRDIFEYLTTKFSGRCQLLQILEPPSFVFAEPCHNYVGPAHSNLKIVVPGTLSYDTKDLTTVSKAIQCTLKKQTDFFQIVFAGKVKNVKAYRWLQRLRKLLADRAEVLYFNEHLRQADYDRILCSADILLLPIPYHTNFAGVIEYYGSTTISGTVNDAIRLNKHALIPTQYPIPSTYHSLFKSYQDAKDLSKIMGDFLTGQLELSKLNEEDLQEHSKRAAAQIQYLTNVAHQGFRQKNNL